MESVSKLGATSLVHNDVPAKVVNDDSPEIIPYESEALIPSNQVACG